MPDASLTERSCLQGLWNILTFLQTFPNGEILHIYLFALLIALHLRENLAQQIVYLMYIHQVVHADSSTSCFIRSNH